MWPSTAEGSGTVPKRDSDQSHSCGNWRTVSEAWQHGIGVSTPWSLRTSRQLLTIPKHPNFSGQSGWEERKSLPRQGDWQEQGRGDIPRHWAEAGKHSPVVSDRMGLRIKAESHNPKSSQYKWKNFQVCKRDLRRSLDRVNPGVVRPEVSINLRPS